MTGRRGTPLERFERHYIPEPNSGCWLWTGSVHTRTGYAQLSMPGSKPVRAHILAHTLFKGPVPRGLDVRHTCDIRCCVNPEHLLLGTRKQNMADAVARDRIAYGFRLPHSRLSDAQIKEIITDPRKQVDIATSYGVDKSYISRLKCLNGARRYKK